MATIFGDFDVTDFWEDCDYAVKNYVEPPPTDDQIAEIEKLRGYKLPAAYIVLSLIQNGGSPNHTCCRTEVPASWADDHVALTGIYAKLKGQRMCLPLSRGEKSMLQFGSPVKIFQTAHISPKTF